MITLQNIVLQRGGLVLLEGASLTVYPGRRVGVIGANGSGKSSLFKLLLGELTQDGGELAIPRQWHIAHMAQEIEMTERTAVDFVMDGDVRLRAIEADIRKAEAGSANNAAAQQRLVKLYAELEAIDGYQALNRAERLLHGLGFTQPQVNEPVKNFSGGWRIRLNLARALMCPSDLLLLDEPTNHLDLDATLWLEQWLKAYPGTLLLISHDRDFLDNIVTDIVNIEARRLIGYRGNYSAYERQRAERLAQQQAVYEKQQQRVAEINRFVARFKAKASKARQAQSRIKELERMEAIAPAHVDSPFDFTFREAARQSDPLLDLRDARLGYDGGKPVLENVRLRLQPGSRIGLLGMNGAGKSTLVKGLVGELPLQAGERVCGEHLAIGYFAQHQLEALDLNASALLHIQRLSPNVSEQDIRNFLGGFNFHGDKALEPIRPFSGGEKARLALAIVVWQRPNLLLLDEPTNHLDLEMRHALTVALQAYSGALVMISHDRHMLRNTVDEFYLVADGGVEPFTGTLEDYQAWLKQAVQNQTATSNPDRNDSTENALKVDKKAQRQQAAAQRERIKPLTAKIRALEKELQTAQARLQQIETELSDPSIYDAANKIRLQNLLQEQGALRKTVEDKEEAWLMVQEELEGL
ncbi:MAG TPA: ATP-binding cassette domain-containing protein [Gammaproteobacteria bacterium]|jgi:ATP-binding cassette subfamily F protein 3